MSGALRIFAAVDLAPGGRAMVAAGVVWVRDLAPRAKWVRPESLHVTLAFLGARSEEEAAVAGAALVQVAQTHAPLVLRPERAGTFGPSRKPRVLFLRVGGQAAALQAIERDLRVALAPLGYEPEHEAYVPHLTLARCKDPRGEPGLAAAAAALASADAGESPAGELVLFRSETLPQGPRYTALARAPLGGP